MTKGEKREGFRVQVPVPVLKMFKQWKFGCAQGNQGQGVIQRVINISHVRIPRKGHLWTGGVWSKEGRMQEAKGKEPNLYIKGRGRSRWEPKILNQRGVSRA